MPKRSNQHMNQKKEHLQSTASKLFKEKGYNSTSINDIVREAKVSKGSFYTYYESKESLFFDIVHGDDKEIISLRDILSYDESYSPIGDYIHYRLRRYFDEENRIRAKYTFEFWSSTTLALDQIEDLRSRYNTFVSEIKLLIELGHEKGFYREDIDCESLIQLLIGSIDGLIVMDTLLYRPINENVIEMAIEMFEYYLARKGGTNDY